MSFENLFDPVPSMRLNLVKSNNLLHADKLLAGTVETPTLDYYQELSFYSFS